MYNSVYVAGKRIPLDSTQSIGSGGEADVYKIASDLALKIFKPPDHPDFHGQPADQQAARERIATHQRKLRELPKGLPSHVVVPLDLATDQTGREVRGYTMKFLSGAEVLMRYGTRDFRQAGITNQMVMEIFTGYHPTVCGVHKAGVIIADHNDLNVLVVGTTAWAWLVDIDSSQFGPYLCTMYTDRFADPLLCDHSATSLKLIKPHNANSDWYAYAVMLFQSLLFVGPYGGVYRPKKPTQRVLEGERPLRRITVFHPNVIYPRPATHWGILPDDLLQKFHEIFEKDWRGEFPLGILQRIRWTKCTNCGTEHARSICPSCAKPAPVEKKEVRGKVTVKNIFSTHGAIVYAAFQDGILRILYHEDGKLKREGGSVVASFEPDPFVRFRLKGEKTLLAKGGRLLEFSPNESTPEQTVVDTYGSLPMFDANARRKYWVSAGHLYRDGQLGPEMVGEVLQAQTVFWVGPTFGFGFYKAGGISVAFVFDAERPGINDRVQIQPIRGQLIDSTAVFSKDLCWFFMSLREGTKTINRCTVISRDGATLATAEMPDGDDSWLGTIRGKCAIGNFLLCATDEGIVRVELSNGQIVQTREFPDTEPWVDSGSHLFPGPNGLYVVKRKEVFLLQIN